MRLISVSAVFGEPPGDSWAHRGPSQIRVQNTREFPDRNAPSNTNCGYNLMAMGLRVVVCWVGLVALAGCSDEATDMLQGDDGKLPVRAPSNGVSSTKGGAKGTGGSSGSAPASQSHDGGVIG